MLAEEIVEHHRSDFKVNEEYLPAAAVHLASRIEEEPRTQKMILDYLEQGNELFTSQSDRRKRKINEVVKKLKKQMDLDLELVRSEEYLQYIVSKLDVVDVDEDVVEAAREYCQAVEEKKGVARSKVAIAGTCLKVALQERDGCDTVSNRDLADATAMNRNTFQNNLEYFREKDLLSS